MFKRSILKKYFPKFLSVSFSLSLSLSLSFSLSLSLSLCLCIFVQLYVVNEFYKFLIILISALIIFFILLLLFLKNFYSGQSGHLDLKIIYTMKESNRFNLVYLILSTATKIHFLFCNNSSKPPVLFMYSPLCFPNYFFSKNAKNKTIRKHKLRSQLTNNLKPKNSCGQSSIKAFYKRLPGKKSKLNMITSTVANKYAEMLTFRNQTRVK